MKLKYDKIIKNFEKSKNINDYEENIESFLFNNYMKIEMEIE